MQIEHYEFGSIVIDGKTYRHDLLIWPGHLETDWWRREGHLLQMEDVTAALAAHPEILVVGMGDPGNMQVDHGLAVHLKREGIDLVALPTREAARVINELADKRRLAAALHLTC